MSAEKRVAAAVATLVFKERRLLLGKRIINGNFEGWQCPGGYLWVGESPQQAARRHCLEKAGLQVHEMRNGPYTSNVFSNSPEVEHSVTLYQLTREFQILNPARFENAEACWQWFELRQLPEPRFLPLELLIQQYDLQKLYQQTGE